MVVNRRKKSNRMRALTTHGWGAKKKHRGSGNRGGYGMAGTGKRADQKKPTINKLYGSSYFGKKGFKRPQSMIKKVNIINFIQINKLIENGLAKKEGNFYYLDLDEMGYTKVLSKGSLKHKVKIKAPSFSEGAKEKIKEQGGEIVSDENT